MPGTRRKGSTSNASAVLAVVGLLAAGLAGCGGSNGGQQDARATDTAAVRNVLSQLQQASRAGDGDRICTQIFTPKLADSVTRAANSGSCAEEVRANVFSPSARLTVEDVTVNDPANATATVKEANGNRSTVFLVKQSGRWRIRSVQPA
jgi:hypothetical protein